MFYSVAFYGAEAWGVSKEHVSSEGKREIPWQTVNIV